MEFQWSSGDEAFRDRVWHCLYRRDHRFHRNSCAIVFSWTPATAAASGRGNPGDDGNRNVHEGDRLSRTARKQKEAGRGEAASRLRLPRISDRMATNDSVWHNLARSVA